MYRKRFLFALAVVIAACAAASISGASGADDNVLLETISVPVTGSSVTSDTTLASGVTYQLRASGTAHVGCEGGDDTDAEWSCFPGGTEDNCNNDPNTTDLGIAINDPDTGRVGRKQPFWGAFDESHVYTIDYVGQGDPISLNFHDCNLGDNGGSLTVEIFGQSSGGSDSSAPAVTIDLDSPGGSTPDGLDGWFRFGPVDVTVAADDSSSGRSAITAVDCGADGLKTTGLGTDKAVGTLALSTDGVHDLSCTATDSAGNTSAPVTQEVKLDTTIPLVQRVPANDTCNGPVGNGWCRAFSGLAAYTITDATSGSTGPIPFVCDPGATCSFVEGVFGQGLIPALFGAGCDLAGNCVCDIPYWVSGGPFCRETLDAFAPFVKLDQVAPAVSRKAQLDSCSVPGGSGWCRGTQSAGFTASDAVSGVGSPCSSPLFGSCDFTKSSSAEGNAIMVSSGQVCDAAGNCADGIQAGPFKIDSTGPTLAPRVGNGPILLHGAATASANATDALSGVASQSCDPVDTSTVGVHALTCTARDNAGNVSSATVRYLVEYKLLGFFALPPSSRILGKLVYVRVAFADARNVRISDGEAESLLGPACRVVFAGEGAQKADGCVTYNTSSDEFRYLWRIGPRTGNETISIAVSYPGSSSTTVLSEPVVIG